MSYDCSCATVEIEPSWTASPHGRQSVSRTTPVIGSRWPDGIELHSSPDGLLARAKANWKEMCPNVVVALASSWLPAGGCRSVWFWSRGGSFLPALVLGRLFLFLVGRRPKDQSFPACDRGRDIPAPGREGRRVQAGASTQEQVFSGIPCYNGLVRVHCGLFPQRCMYDSLAFFSSTGPWR